MYNSSLTIYCARFETVAGYNCVERTEVLDCQFNLATQYLRWWRIMFDVVKHNELKPLRKRLSKHVRVLPKLRLKLTNCEVDSTDWNGFIGHSLVTTQLIAMCKKSVALRLSRGFRNTHVEAAGTTPKWDSPRFLHRESMPKSGWKRATGWNRARSYHDWRGGFRKGGCTSRQNQLPQNQVEKQKAVAPPPYPEIVDLHNVTAKLGHQLEHQLRPSSRLLRRSLLKGPTAISKL